MSSSRAVNNSPLVTTNHKNSSTLTDSIYSSIYILNCRAFSGGIVILRLWEIAFNLFIFVVVFSSWSNGNIANIKWPNNQFTETIIVPGMQHRSICFELVTAVFVHRPTLMLLIRIFQTLGLNRARDTFSFHYKVSFLREAWKKFIPFVRRPFL